jgi:hypothetical protein
MPPPTPAAKSSLGYTVVPSYLWALGIQSTTQTLSLTYQNYNSTPVVTELYTYSTHIQHTRWSPNRLQLGLRFLLGFRKQSAQKMTPHHIWSIFQEIFIWLERYFHNISNSIGPGSIASRSRRQFTKQVDDQNLSGCCATSLEPMDRVSCGNPIGACPEGHPRHKPHTFSSRRHIRVRVLFGSCLPSRNCFLHCDCDDKSFLLWIRPRSCSSPLWWLVLLWSELEPHLDLCFIHICNFRLHAYPFLLVFFDSLAGKAFSARSIKLCLVDNQQSSGVTVAGLRIVSD